MSCKSTPKISETRIQLITKLEKRRTEKLCRHYGFKMCIGILLFIVLSYCIFLHSSLKKMQKFVAKLELNQPEILVKRHLDIGEQRLTREQKRRRRNNIVETLKNKINDLQTLPLVHLQGTDRVETAVRTGAGCPHDQPCFLWKNPNHLYQNEFIYVRKGGNKVVGVNITRAGYYHVYSQISVHGLVNEDNLPSLPAFGYETIIVRGSRAIALTRSFITQDQRGQWYSTVNGNNVRPLDSMNQMGIFRLNCGDTIMVRSTDQLVRHNIKFLQDPKQTYFGLALLRPKGLDNYSCY